MFPVTKSKRWIDLICEGHHICYAQTLEYAAIRFYSKNVMFTAPPNLHCKQSSGSLIVGPEDLIKLQESYQMIFCKEFEKTQDKPNKKHPKAHC